jgi:hypothetical protein
VQPVRCWVAFGIAALAFAACSGSDGDAAPVTSAVAVTTSVAETTAATTTTPPQSSTSTTVVATTTLPATTTTVATEDLIKQAVQDYIAGYFACGQEPAACDPSTFTSSQGSSRVTVTDLASSMSANGLMFSTDLRGSYLVAESVAAESSQTATAIYCAYDATAVLGPIGPDGLPTVVNDEVLSYTYEYDVYLDATEWRVGSQRQLASLGEGNLCPPSE